jgi:hypothetical protein
VDSDIVVVANIGSGITLWVPKTPLGESHIHSLPTKPWQHLGGNLVVPQGASPMLVKEAIAAGLIVDVREESTDGED